MNVKVLLEKFRPTFNPKVDLASLKESEYNPRKATKEQYRDLKNSLSKFGPIAPLIVNSAPNRQNIVIGGHFRRRVLLDEGVSQAPVIFVNIPDIEEEKELNLRLNKNTGEWDVDLLANMDDQLLADVGFDFPTIDQIFGNKPFEDDFSGQEEYDKIKKTTTKPGQIIELGKHRLMCGDSTEDADVKKLMDGKPADMIFTDPPYNVNYKGTGKNTTTKILNDSMSEDKFIDFCTAWAKVLAENIKTGGVFYICSGYASYPTYAYALRTAGLQFSQPIVWVKDAHSIGWSDFKHKHEMILRGKFKRDKKAQALLYGWKKGRHYFDGVHDEADVWAIKRRSGNTMVHPTQKPIEMVTRAMLHSSKRGEKVLDLFGGSGSTLISAELNGRTCYLMEKDPKFCDVIKARWENMAARGWKK